MLSPLPDPGRRAAEYASTNVLYRLAIVATASSRSIRPAEKILKGGHPDAAAYGESRITRQGRCALSQCSTCSIERVASEDNAFGRTVGLGSHCSEDLFGSSRSFRSPRASIRLGAPRLSRRRYRLGGQSGSGLAIEVELILVLRQLFTCRWYEQFEEPPPAGLGGPGGYLFEPLNLCRAVSSLVGRVVANQDLEELRYRRRPNVRGSPCHTQARTEWSRSSRSGIASTCPSALARMATSEPKCSSTSTPARPTSNPDAAAL